MTHHEASARVRAYITENFLYMRPGLVFSDSDALLGRGIIDSMGVIELVTFVQDEFGVTIDDDDLTEANLGSIAAISEFVIGKRTRRLAS